MADGGRRPPAYNPHVADNGGRAHSAVDTPSPPPYCGNVHSGSVQMPRPCPSLPKRIHSSRSRPALSNMSWNNESSVNSPASQSSSTGGPSRTLQPVDVSVEWRHCNSAGTGRRRFQFDTISRERGRQVANDVNAAPPPPPRQLPGELVGSPLKCLQRFSVYSHEDIAGRGPHTLTSVDVSDSGSVLIVDSQSMLVHVFSSHGIRLCQAFKVLGVCGGCFWKENRVVLATHRGFKICQLDGLTETDMVIGPVVCIKRYKLSFIAVQRKCLTFYGGLSSKLAAGVSISKVRSRSLLRRRKSFVEIADIAVNKSILVVLDIGRNVIYRIDQNGTKISKFVPNGNLHSDIRFAPGIAVDAHSNVIVCDGSNKQLLQFQPTGKFICCLLNFSVRVGGVEIDGVPLLHGITTNHLGQLFVTLSGDKMAEVRIYRF